MRPAIVRGWHGAAYKAVPSLHNSWRIPSLNAILVCLQNVSLTWVLAFLRIKSIGHLAQFLTRCDCPNEKQTRCLDRHSALRPIQVGTSISFFLFRQYEPDQFDSPRHLICGGVSSSVKALLPCNIELRIEFGGLVVDQTHAAPSLASPRSLVAGQSSVAPFSVNARD